MSAKTSSAADLPYALISKALLQRAWRAAILLHSALLSHSIVRGVSCVTRIPTSDLVPASLVLLTGFGLLHPFGSTIIYHAFNAVLFLHCTWRAIRAAVALQYWESATETFASTDLAPSNAFCVDGRIRRLEVKRAVECLMALVGLGTAETIVGWSLPTASSRPTPGAAKWWILVFKVWAMVYLRSVPLPLDHSAENASSPLSIVVRSVNQAVLIPHGITVMATPPTPADGLDLNRVRMLLGDDVQEVPTENSDCIVPAAPGSSHRRNDSLSSVASSGAPQTPPSSVFNEDVSAVVQDGEDEIRTTNASAIVLPVLPEADPADDTKVLPSDLAASIKAVARFRTLLSRENDRLQAEASMPALPRAAAAPLDKDGRAAKATASPESSRRKSISSPPLGSTHQHKRSVESTALSASLEVLLAQEGLFTDALASQ